MSGKFHGYTKAECEGVKTSYDGQIGVAIFFGLVWLVIALPTLLTSCPKSSGVSFCGSMLTEKVGTVIGLSNTLEDNNNEACFVQVKYAYEGSVNYSQSGDFYNYIGGSSCVIIKNALDHRECVANNWQCPHCLHVIEGDYIPGSVNTIWYNEDLKKCQDSQQLSTTFWVSIGSFCLLGLTTIFVVITLLKRWNVPEGSDEPKTHPTDIEMSHYAPVFSKTKPKDPPPMDILYSVGIAKLESTDYIFSEIRTRHFVGARRPDLKEPEKPYFIYSPFQVVDPCFQEQCNDFEELKTWLVTELALIRGLANDKKQELFEILIQCPFNTWSYKINIFFWQWWDTMAASVDKIVTNPVCNFLIAVLFYLVAVGLLLPVFLVIQLLFFLWDFVSMLLFDSISKEEIDWFDKFFDEQPDLCTFAIDNMVKDEIDKLATKVHERYPKVFVDVWTGVEEQFIASYDNGSTHYCHRVIEKDEFMIRFHKSGEHMATAIASSDVEVRT